MKIYIRSSKYCYIGNVEDKFGKILIRDGEFYTSAPSIKKAESNILSQAKGLLNLKQSAYLKLCNPDKIEEVLEEEPTIEDNIEYCPECGYRLSDGGYCPRCYAYGDESNYN